MSSHREAPEISKDPVADSTDLYAFVSPDKPDTVTLIANYVPLRARRAARTSTSSATTCCTRSTSTTTATAEADITYQFRSTTEAAQPEHVPVQHRPDHVAEQPELEPPADLLGHPRRPARPRAGARPATWPARRATSARCPRRTTPRAGGQPSTRCTAAARCSPASAPRASTSTWARSSTWATCGRSRSCNVFGKHGVQRPCAGRQRDQRPERAHDRPPGADRRTPTTVAGRPVDRRVDHAPAGSGSGVGTHDGAASDVDSGPCAQVSRLGNPLVNEVIIPMGKKDYWNAQPPARRQAVRQPSRAPRAGRRCCRRCTRGCSRTWPR